MYTVKEMKHGLSWAVLRPSDKTIGGTYCIATSYDPDDARRIARALNREAAMGEVREKAMKESEDWPRPGIFEAGARYVLAALDRAGEV